eukprot:7775867-Pyramimonas_sp.AAC.1
METAQKVLDVVYEACCRRGRRPNGKRTKFLLVCRGPGPKQAQVNKDGQRHAVVRSGLWDFEADIVSAHRVLGSYIASSDSMATEIVTR